jgi:hypothetical protein
MSNSFINLGKYPNTGNNQWGNVNYNQNNNNLGYGYGYDNQNINQKPQNK